MKNRHYYNQHIGDLKQRLKDSLDTDALRDLHQVRPWRHFATVIRLLAVVGLCGWALWQTRWPGLWVPAAILQGFNLLGFIILLHEWVHDSIFRTRRPGLQRLLGLLYAAPTAISATQFRIWHLDHHNELGSEVDDPKRAHLSPKRNARWFKLLYATPALFFIYAKAAGSEVKTYDAVDRRRINLERLGNLLVQLGIVAAISMTGGGWVLMRIWFIPLFFVFPLAFSLNRLGQHYNIDRNDPAKWSSRVDGNPIWHFIFLWSNFHIEHHYYPRVPFYNLRKLNRDLRPFFRKNRVENLGYVKIVWGWIVRNRKPHTDWSRAES
ncbi:MAG: fatty acid desaturase [Acidobacteriota bacterium]|nr:fatty acid desaturase [Acidobacteriota bacterium]MDH3785777.1 fatty acid desaturase [Acidobacteriota bacterium]